MRASLLALATAVLGLLGAPTVAAAACTISASGVSFGSYNVFSNTPLDASGTVTYQCFPLAINVQIQLSRGAPRASRRGRCGRRLRRSTTISTRTWRER